MRNLEYGEYGEYGGGLRAIILLLDNSLSEFILNPGLAPESKEGVRSPSKIPNGIQMSPK